MPPNYVKAYVRRQKNDEADAAAICEAVTRPSMQFVPIRLIDNQAVLMHHKVREILVSQRTQFLNALRGHLGGGRRYCRPGTEWSSRIGCAILEGDSSFPLCVRDALAPLSVSCRRSTMRSPQATAPSWSWQRPIRQLGC